jgi:cytochrome P450
MPFTDEESALPQGVELTAVDDRFREDPYAILKVLRERAPLHHDRVMNRYICTRHDDVKTLLHDKEFFTDPRNANPGSFSREVLGGRLGFGEKPDMLLMDEPDHRRLRRLVSGPFKPSAVEGWREEIRRIVGDALDAITETEFDLIARFAAPVPTVVIARMLGVDPALYEQFHAWSDQVVQVGFNPFPTEEQQHAAAAARQALDELFSAEIARRGDEPGDDLLSDMIRAEIEGDKLTQQEMIAQCRLLLIAGNVTTTDLIGNGTRALLDFPEQMEKLRADPGLIGNAVEEMLRYDSPVTNSGRTPNRDIVVSGCPVPRGESLSLSLAAANRDPAVYPEPDQFDIERADTHHQAFGGGRHLCLGAHLARVEAQEAILGLLRRFPRLRKSGRGHVFHAIPSFRGMREFWVRCD